MAQVALLRTDNRTDALRDAVSELLSMDEPRKHFAARMSGLDIRYNLGQHDRRDHDAGHGLNGPDPVSERTNSDKHPLLGRRIPDLDLTTVNGPRRLFTLLHKARPVLLNLGEPDRLDIAPWADRVELVEAEYGGVWNLPVLGAVAAPAAVLIRPDGHVAWVSNEAHRRLRNALTTWFGPPLTGWSL
jgi:hypothetical protein